MPPNILNAGIVSPKKSKMYLPATVKDTIIRKAVKVDILATRFREMEFAFSVRLIKTGMFAIGFMMAKKPANTLIENNQMSCITLVCTLSEEQDGYEFGKVQI